MLGAATIAAVAAAAAAAVIFVVIIAVAAATACTLSKCINTEKNLLYTYDILYINIIIYSSHKIEAPAKRAKAIFLYIHFFFGDGLMFFLTHACLTKPLLWLGFDLLWMDCHRHILVAKHTQK